MKTLVTVLALATCASAGSAIYLYSSNRGPAVASRTSPVTPVASTALEPPTAESHPEIGRQTTNPGELSGRLAAASEVDVRATAPGYVLRMRVEPGDFVEKGQTLVELENLKLEEEVRHAEMALQLAQSDLEAQRLRVANAEHRLSETVSSPGTVRENAETQLRAVRNESQHEQARVAEADAVLVRARRTLSEAQILAPASGCVSDRRVSVGDRVRPGTALMRIVDTSKLTLTVNCDANAARLAADGAEPLVTVDAFSERQFPGKIVIGSSGSHSKSPPASLESTTASIEIENRDHLLRPGQFAHVRLIMDRERFPRTAAATRRFESSSQQSRPPVVDNANGGNGVGEMLTSVKGLAATITAAAAARTQELTQKQEATKITVEATTKYFERLEQQLNDLRPEISTPRVVNLERTAEQIDNFPVLHVDEELVLFGADVAQGLRMMAERRRSNNRSTSYADVTISEKTQGENSAIRTQGMQRIIIGLASMRRKMTKKYNLEFLATVTNARSAAGRRTTRR